MVVNLLIGALAGLHAACCGAYKDSPYERFVPQKFGREILLGMGTALAFSLLVDVSSVNKGILFLIFVGLNRIVTEAYKLFFRDEPQDKYAFPSQIHFLGKVVRQRLVRLVFLCPFLLTIFAAYKISVGLTQGLPLQLRGAMIGFAFGVATTLGGAYKDGFFEGFKIGKFIKSPFLNAATGFLVSFVTGVPFLIFLSSLGLERMITEFYKAFLKRGYTPAKFSAIAARYPKALTFRKRLVPIYILTWVICLVLSLPTLIDWP